MEEAYVRICIGEAYVAESLLSTGTTELQSLVYPCNPLVLPLSLSSAVLQAHLQCLGLHNPATRAANVCIVETQQILRLPSRSSHFTELTFSVYVHTVGSPSAS